LAAPAHNNGRRTVTMEGGAPPPRSSLRGTKQSSSRGRCICSKACTEYLPSSGRVSLAYPLDCFADARNDGRGAVTAGGGSGTLSPSLRGTKQSSAAATPPDEKAGAGVCATCANATPAARLDCFVVPPRNDERRDCAAPSTVIASASEAIQCRRTPPVGRRGTGVCATCANATPAAKTGLLRRSSSQ
jgi:hypothetical protein